MATSTQSITTGTDTKEYRTIKRHFDALVDNLGSTVGDPARFARRLREKSLISDGECTWSHRLASFLNGVHVHPRCTSVMYRLQSCYVVDGVSSEVLFCQSSHERCYMTSEHRK